MALLFRAAVAPERLPEQLGKAREELRGGPRVLVKILEGGGPGDAPAQPPWVAPSFWLRAAPPPPHVHVELGVERAAVEEAAGRERRDLSP